ncbi:MAG: GNAT family N-acetyltransferase [Alphaproteobacteria bacterium]|nr:GNAT family N-acetyltransferase [Alphaproteobacteria bacterium]MBU1516162.1 GNAT family N-acetyltransferase [Alphaproteobacteria bacterium]MBU2097111.1 GNAT family N-acetyltransferase [Alphaproteobacteria bacterium]MBU2152079.1 GNAT family N-acetyltransferase [Alphaproteobacteria bacterium]MBU2309680.1 GNAT family N-acetyltransferase [Alphaproteobacteria bacterium]
MPKVELEAARTPAGRTTVENLFQLYVHDFADFWATRQVELQADGRFPPYPPLAAYWSEAGAEPFLIRADGEIAGFALIDRHSHSGKPTDFNMGEFFVARHYRREGVGRDAALAAIRTRAGQWEIAVARRNLPAQPFWRAVAAAVAAGPVEETEQANELWNGLILRFVVV